MSLAAIEMDHLERQTFGDPDLQREILELFLRQSLKLAELLLDATPTEQRDLAHTLKGSARAVGAMTVADASEEVEMAAGSNGAVEAVLRLRAAVQEAAAEIRRLIVASPQEPVRGDFLSPSERDAVRRLGTPTFR